MNLDEIGTKVSRLEAEHKLAKDRARTERRYLRSIGIRLQHATEAQIVLQQVAKEVQTLAHGKIAAIATSCLAAVFDDPPRLSISFVAARNKTEARIQLTHNDVTLEDPLDEESAGMLSVGVFALRLADLILSQPAKRRVLILDEPFSGVQTSLIPKLAEMVSKLAEELGLQIILTTHQTGWTGKVIKLGD